MGKSFDPMGWGCAGAGREAHGCTPRPIVSTSFQLAIPWRVALPQSPPPLHQPGTIMHERAAAGHQKPANGQQCLNYLSHPRGQVHISRRDGERTNTIKAYTQADALPQEVTKVLLAQLEEAGFAMPAGYHMEIGGDAEENQEATDSPARAGRSRDFPSSVSVKDRGIQPAGRIPTG